MKRGEMKHPTTAVVVGGGSGIGASVVEEYRQVGVVPVVWDVAGDFDICCDISDAAAIEAAVAETCETIGVPDQLTITAGIGHSALLLDEPLEAFDRVIAVNTRGPWLVSRALAREMIAGDVPGSIVVASSISAHLADLAMGAYCASKAALNMLVKVASCEWAPFDIRVNAIGPGVTETPMLGRAPRDKGWLAGVSQRTPLRRLGRPSDVSQGIMALHALKWVTGQVLECDGGLSLHSPIDSYVEGYPARSSSS